MAAKRVADFSVASTGGTFTLSEHKGHPVVLYFYPKDDTPGCTVEACSFRDDFTKLTDKGVEVVGVSGDSAKTHELFKKEHKLPFKAKMKFPFELIADADEKLCTRFGVIKMKNMYGRQVRGIERSTFLIGPDGTLVSEWRKVKADGHAREVLDAVAAL